MKSDFFSDIDGIEAAAKQQQLKDFRFDSDDIQHLLSLIKKINISTDLGCIRRYSWSTRKRVSSSISIVGIPLPSPLCTLSAAMVPACPAIIN
ncbi:MAG: hypothetical protein K8R46_11710 [Pirellulales bacterium]|nr:hypothetical protein [Pirellulales bacterium]